MGLSVFGTGRISRMAGVGCLSFAVLALLIAPVLVSGQNSGFTINSNPPSLCVNPGINAKTVISVSSDGGFAGTVDTSDSLSPTYTNGPTLSSIPSSVTLTSGQTVSFEVAISTTSSTPDYAYLVTVRGFSGGSYHEATVQLVVSSSCTVGGTVLPVDQLSLLLPYLTAAAFAIALVGTAVTVIVYRTRHK